MFHPIGHFGAAWKRKFCTVCIEKIALGDWAEEIENENWDCEQQGRDQNTTYHLSFLNISD